MDLVLRKNPGRMLCTPRVHTQLHWSTLLAEVLSPRLPRLVITLDSFQRCGRQYSFTSEIYPPDVTPGQQPPYDSWRIADTTDAGADDAPPPNSGLDGVQC